MMLWPWVLFASLAALEIGLESGSRRLGAVHVNAWLFSHREHLPIPFLLLGIATLLCSPHPLSTARYAWLDGVGFTLILAGESLRVWCVGIVGAATRSASINAKRLIESGPYALTRNPIYLGNLLICLGISSFAQSWAVTAACLGYFVVVYRRIILAEERFLRATFGVSYEEFRQRVPRVLPRLRGWRQALAAPFRVKELRKEYQTIAGIACASIVIYALMTHPQYTGRLP